MLSNYFILLKQELIIAAIIFILLFIKLMFKESSNKKTLLQLCNIFLLINFAAGFFLNGSGALFNDMFKTNELIALEKNMLNLATLLVSMLAYSWLKNHLYIIEFYLLLLATLLGMFFMLSSDNLLMFYLSLELSTIPLAALCNFDLEKRKSSEAAMKLIISSAFSSALLLLGISFIYGTTGTFNLTDIPKSLTGSGLQLYAFILLAAGFCFKISAVPFHLWTADVYEGSPAPVTAYLSVVSKAAFIFVFTTVLYTVFKPLVTVWYNMLIVLSLLTMLTGNLFAIRQNNLKRFLAFSSIAQVGFILMGISGLNKTGSASAIFFLLVYIFSNLGAFAVISVVSAAMQKETIEDYKGFYKKNKLLTWILTLSLFSLAGIPPAAGFFGKFFLVIAGASSGSVWFITFALLNMVISLYYYLRVIKAMFMDENESPIEKIHVDALPATAMFICAAAILCIGFAGFIYNYIYSLSPAF